MYKVVLADDEIWMNIGLKKQIETSRLPFCVVGEANDGVSALAEVKEKKADVLFADIRMPGMNGIQLLEQIKMEQLPTKCVLISGYAEFSYAQQALRGGAFDYLLKPVEQEHLEEVLKELQKCLKKQLKDLNENIKEAGITLEYEPSVMEQIIRQIQESYLKNISLTELSRQYMISAPRLSTLLKEHLGVSFSEYIAARRIQKAKELLRNEKYSLSEVADAVGYHDYFYFIRVFKKVTGISPSQYRKSIGTMREK